MSAPPTVRLTPVVRFREFPFGTLQDPSMGDFISDEPGPHQADALRYLRSGVISAIPMGGDLPDWRERSRKANPVIDGERLSGLTEMTDGVYLWFAALIYYVEEYNLRLPREFLDHAARHNWVVDRASVLPAHYEVNYF
jgi:hypothetical protein